MQVGTRVVVKEFGEDPLDAIEKHLVLEPQQPPDPASLRPTDVIIAVKSAAVAWVDLLMTSGQYQHMPKPPYCPGLEFCGEIVWAGSAASGVKIGDAVLADGLLTGPRSKGDHQQWGGFETYAVAPVEAVHPLPKWFSFDQACNLGNYETAYHCLIACAKLEKGETVLIHGASGSSGLASVHLAKLLGATVIATGRSPDKLAIVKANGADHVVCTVDDKGEPRSFRDDVKALTNGRGVDVVYDGVGGATSIESLRCVDFGARFLIVGWASTPDVARGKGQRGAPNANVLPTNLILMKGLKVLGCPMAISTHRDPSIRAPRLARLNAWAESGALVPVVSATFPISEVKEAMKAKWASLHVGGIVLHPQD